MTKTQARAYVARCVAATVAVERDNGEWPVQPDDDGPKDARDRALVREAIDELLAKLQKQAKGRAR